MSASRIAGVLFCLILIGWDACLARKTPKEKGSTPAKASNRTGSSPVAAPPVAKRVPKKLSLHGDVRIDQYFWLRDDDREEKDVLDYLAEENAYFDTIMADTEEVQKDLFKELRKRIKEDDLSVPQREGDYFYYKKTVTGAQYKMRCRRKIPEGMGSPSEYDEMDESIPEELLLDENKEAELYDFYDVKGFGVSPDHKLMKYSEDTKGDEQYTLHVKEIATGKEMLEYPIENTSGDIVFANNGKFIVYVTKNDLNQPNKAWLHTIGTSPKDDKLLYHEKDEQFFIHTGRTRDRKYIFIIAQSSMSSEIRFMDAEDPNGEWIVLYEREYDVDYGVAHRDGYIFVNVRDTDRPNSEMLIAPLSDPSNQTVLVPHMNDTEIDHFEVFENYLVIFARENGLQTGTVYKLPEDGSPPTSLGEGKPLEFDEPSYEMAPGSQGDVDSDILRIDYTSLTTPSSVIDFNLATGNHVFKKVSPVNGKFDRKNYVTKRIWATSKDKTKVPISLVYKRDALKRDGSNPLFMFVYGAYGSPMDPKFASNRLSLLNRGFVYAIAHVRGGGEMGRHWYEEGKFFQKKNTFADTIACVEELIRQNYTSPEKMSMIGGSAGGMTAATVVNMRPDLFKAVILAVPFVDVLTSMLDESLPLTAIEWEEWGDPRLKGYYYYMKSYSPLDNVKKQGYPHLLVTSGLHDPRVGYWEPAKFTAKLRSMKTDDNMLIMKCDKSSGHFSKSGRFDELEEVAMQYSFLLKALGVAEFA